MYDRGLSVLEQYGLQAVSVRRGRGVLICETAEGTVLIREFCGTQKKLESQAALLGKIAGETRILTDEILKNREGGYVSSDSENIPYVVKRWYEGKECDTRNEKDICSSMAALAQLHKAMQMPVQEHYVRECLPGEFDRHNRELRKIRKFISTKRRKNDFEQLFLDSVSLFLSHGEEAQKRLSCSGYQKLREDCLGKGTVCHGEYNQHNILFAGEARVAVTNFDKWNFDMQTADIYQFMRKILEKHDWSGALAGQMLHAYEQVRTLSKEEKENLMIRFSYPEKYWKLANHYYTHKKAWISQKSVEKMEKLIEQHDKWRNFTEKKL